MTSQEHAINSLCLRPLAQFERGEPWRLTTLHDRPDYLMVWITKGQGLARLSGRRLGIGAHSALLIPPETLFALELLRNAGALVLSMSAPQATALAMPHRPHILRLREVQDQAEITHRLEAIQRELDRGDGFAGDAVSAHGALLSVTLRRMLAALPPAPAPSGAERLSEAFCALINRYHRETHSLKEYAQMLGVSQPHLTRSCKQACGLTAADILAARCLYAARDRIETTDQPFNQLAQSLGFGSAAYFSRFVQKHTGKSPSTLRKAAQKSPPQPARDRGRSMPAR